jgi:hypothetical protein
MRAHVNDRNGANASFGVSWAWWTAPASVKLPLT